MPEALALLPVLAGASAPFDIAAGTGVIAGTAYISGVAIGSTALLTTVSSIALSVGLSYAATLLTPSRPSPPSQASQSTVNESTAARTRGYGRVMIGGARVAWENVAGASAPIGASSGRLSILAHAQGPIDAIEEYWFADQKATFATGSVPAFGVQALVSDPASSNISLISFQGTGTQASSSVIRQLYSLWSAADTLRGVAYTAVYYNSVSDKNFMATYKSSEPAMRVVARVTKVWDPRDGAQNPNDSWDNSTTWSWSANAGLCILDYLRHPDGRNKPLSRIDVQSFVDFANLCDEAVAKKHGGTEPRYQLHGSYTLMDEPSSVLQRMLATCDATLYRTPAGLIGIRGGQWVEPTLTFQGDAILGFSLTQGVGALVAFNRTTITYTSPAHDYQSVEADPWVDSVSEAALGTLGTSLQLDMVQSDGQARRLAKINAYKNNPDWKGQITLDVTGLNAITERVIRVITPADDLGLNEVFLVTKAAIAGDFTSVTLDVVSLSSDAYAWTPASEEGEAPPIVPVVDFSSLIPTPSGVSVTTGGVGGASSITVAVAPPADATLRLVVRWAVHGTSSWSTGFSSAGVWNYNTATIPDGTSYDVQCWFASTSAVQGAMTSVSTVAIAAGVGVPSAPSGLSAVNSSGTVTLGATAPNDSNVIAVAFWVASGSTFGSSTKIATVYCAPNAAVTASHSPGAGTWHYWATAESAAGDSAPAGPVSVTV